MIWGTSSQRGQQRGDLGRMSALDAGYDIRASGVTLDRFCGSGITAVNLAAATIMSGMADLVVAGGTEMMSLHRRHAPSRTAASPLFDAGNMRLRKQHPQTQQGICADTIATMEASPAQAVDALAWRASAAPPWRSARAASPRAWSRSTTRTARLALDHEEFPRPQTTAEGLAGLKPSFEAMADMPSTSKGPTFRSLILQKYPDLKIKLVHHAGNSSGVVDGSAAVLLASPDYAKNHGLKPRARVVAMANMGDCPTLMLNAPAPATRKILAKAGLTVDDIDLFEINEAFAVVAEKFIRDLRLDREKVNVNGGAMRARPPDRRHRLDADRHDARRTGAARSKSRTEKEAE